MSTRHLFLVLVILSTCLLSRGAAQSWQAPPANVRATVGKLTPALHQAMNGGNLEQVDAVVAQVRQALGDWAGDTEVETKYYQPVDSKAPPSLAQIREGWAALFSATEAQYKGNGHWRSATPSPLRETCDVVLGFSDAVKANAGGRDLLLQQIKESLEYLLTVQAANGVFPFPDSRDKDPFFGPMLKRYAAQHPDAFQNGWMISDAGDGGLQFDNGTCGNAMLAGYDLLHDKRYLESARRAANWALSHELVANFNYNSFSVWLLAKMYQQTGERKYLESALHKAQFGVLPGQMQNGRWLDPHNARPAYHWIIVRALLQLDAVVPYDNSLRPSIHRSLISAIDNGTREILDHGAPSFETPLAVLPLACAAADTKPQWTEALNVLINAVFNAAQHEPSKIAGISPYGYASYFLFRTRQLKA